MLPSSQGMNAACLRIYRNPFRLCFFLSSLIHTIQGTVKNEKGSSIVHIISNHSVSQNEKHQTYYTSNDNNSNLAETKRHDGHEAFQYCNILGGVGNNSRHRRPIHCLCSRDTIISIGIGIEIVPLGLFGIVHHGKRLCGRLSSCCCRS